MRSQIVGGKIEANRHSFGVSRVFSQQCAYVLTDIQGLQDKMRGTTMLLKELEIDKNASTTR